MLSKWIIEGIDGYIFDKDGNLYRLPFESKGKYYGIRLIKKQYPNRYRINGQWYSQRQLRSKLRQDPEPKEFLIDDLPF